MNTQKNSAQNSRRRKKHSYGALEINGEELEAAGHTAPLYIIPLPWDHLLSLTILTNYPPAETPGCLGGICCSSCLLLWGFLEKNTSAMTYDAFSTS